MRILLVEDSERLRETVALYLRESGYAVDESGNGEEGLWKAQNTNYDVIIFDIMLPGLDGLSALRQLRKEDNNAQIILLTARDTINDRVSGLRSGADDYLVKPFAMDELLARIEVLGRRAYGQKSPELEIGPVTINTAAKTVTVAGEALEISPREYAIFEYLALRRGTVISRSEVEEHVYDDCVSPMSNVVDRSICSLRKKLKDACDNEKIIETRRGQGFIIEANS